MSAKRKIQIILNKICPDLYNYIYFFVKNHYFYNISNPQTFNEKIQWRKKYQHDSRYPLLVDKWEVRNYVSEICPDILVPTYGVFNSVEEINFDLLPDAFIMKPTHGFGQVIICIDKNTLDRKKVMDRMKSWFSYNQFSITGEWQYKDIRPRVIVDQLLGENIKDYKFFCFDGEPYAIQIDSDRYFDHKRQIRDINWNRIECSLAYPNDETELDKPKQLDAMLKICYQLSKNFDFVRVDLFLIKGKIFFSEMTFTPGNGMDRFRPKEMDYQFGRKWNLCGLEGYDNENSVSRKSCNRN